MDNNFSPTGEDTRKKEKKPPNLGQHLTTK